MLARTALAALDHNQNVERDQVNKLILNTTKLIPSLIEVDKDRSAHVCFKQTKTWQEALREGGESSQGLQLEESNGIICTKGRVFLS